MGGNINSSNVNLTDHIPSDVAKLLQDAHDVANVMMKAGTAVALVGAVFKVPPAAMAGAYVGLTGVSVHGLAYTMEAWYELVYFR